MQHAETGVTLIEACIVVTICAVVAAMAVPSMRSLIERQTLRGSADELRTDLHYLRSASISRGERLWLAVQAGADGSCYLIHSGHQGDCRCDASGHAACDGEAQALKAVGFKAGGRVQLQSTSGALAFEPARGTLTPTATLKLANAAGEAVHHVLNVMGRARSCSPGAKVPGYKAC
jgi:type IV fimbrial biogenesis protein FimT